MAISYRNVTHLLSGLGDIDVSAAIVGDGIFLDTDGIWRAAAGGGGGGGGSVLTVVSVNPTYFTGDGRSSNPVSLVEGGISHDNLANINSGTNYLHLTSTQVSALHVAVTVSNSSNSLIQLSIDSNTQVLSGEFLSSNFTFSHTNLTSVNGASNVQHLTAAQVSSLHPLVTVSNASNTAVTLSIDSNQVISGTFNSSNYDSLSVPLTGFVAASGTIAATDSVLTAFNKTQGSISALEAKYVRATRFTTISSGTSGTITIPTGATIILDDFGGTVDAIVSGITDGKPNYDHVLTAGGVVVSTTFDALGNYTLSGTPSAYPVALIYRTRSSLANWDDTASDILGDVTVDPLHNQLVGLQGGTTNDYQHLTTAQVSGLHSAVTISNDSNSGVQLSLTGQQLSATAADSNISHNSLSGVSGGITGNRKHIATFDTVANAKLAGGAAQTVIYIEEKEALYSYCGSCAYPADDDLLLTTGDGGNSRWELIQKMSRTQGDTGWINTDNATISALSTTQVRLTISSTAAIAIKGVRYSVPNGDYDLTITGAAGPKFIHMLPNMTLASRDTLWDFNSEVPVMVVYWSGTAIVAAPQTEFHGIRDTVWHSWAHRFVGTQYVSGLSFTGNVQPDNNNNPGADDTVAYLWSTTGVIQDEDIQSSPGTGQWTQDLGSGLTSSNAAIMNYFYFNGSFVTTANAMADRAPFIHAGAGTTPQWNNGGTLTASVTGDYIVYHYFATPMTGGWSVFARPHNAKYSSLATALAARPSQLTWSNYAELKHLYTAVFRVLTTWGNTHKCKLVSLSDYRTVAATPGAAVPPTSHASLSSLEYAGPGVTYGHVSDQAQTIAGFKTLQDGASIAGFEPRANYVLNPNGELSRIAYMTLGAGITNPGDSPTALIGSKSFRLTGATTAGATTWWQWDLKTIDSFFAGKPLSFSLKTSASVASAFRVSVYNVTDATELTETQVVIPGGMYEAKGFFIPVAGKAYGLRITQITNGTNTCDVDDVYVGEVPVRYGQAVTDWQIYTPTYLGFGTVSASTAQWRRVGDSIHVEFAFISGTNTGVIPSVSLPTGLSRDDTKIVNNAVVGTFGTSQTAYTGSMATYTSQSNVICMTANNAAINAGSLGTSWPNNTLFSGFFIVPIVGWGSNIQVADRALEEYASNSNATNTASDTTSFAYGAAGSFVPNGAVGTAYRRRVQFQSAIQSTDSIVIEIDQGGDIWTPSEFRFPLTLQGTNAYGIAGERVTGSSTQFEVLFNVGGFVSNNATYGGNGAAWSGISGWKYRVRKVSGGAQVGFPISAANIVGRTDGLAPAAGMIGEQLLQTWTGTTITTTTPVAVCTHAAVVPGIYLFIVETDATKGSSIRVTSAFGGTATKYVSKYSEGGDFVQLVAPAAIGFYATYYARVTVSGSITFTVTTAGGNITDCRGSFSIVRIA